MQFSTARRAGEGGHPTEHNDIARALNRVEYIQRGEDVQARLDWAIAEAQAYLAANAAIWST
jgi:hypothetical protein